MEQNNLPKEVRSTDLKQAAYDARESAKQALFKKADDAQELITRGVELAEEAVRVYDDDEMRLNLHGVLYYLHWYFRYSKQYDRAYEIACRMLEVAEKLQSKVDRLSTAALSCRVMGEVHGIAGMYAEAVEDVQMGIALLSDEEKDKYNCHNLALLYMVKATALRDDKQYSEAEAAYLTAIGYARDLALMGDKTTANLIEYRARIQCGKMEVTRGMYAEAEEHMKIGIEKADIFAGEDRQNADPAVRARIAYSTLLTSQGRYAEAEIELTNAMLDAVRVARGKDILSALVHEAKGYLYKAMNRYPDAKDEYGRALECTSRLSEVGKKENADFIKRLEELYRG